ncbi:hypothetical protein [Ectopseudomonas mendocina]|uniref:Competence protein CoiA nuclease-like domain-containing protein n=1 Tax=Ectopseudomonas mendocina TaxID=300 RepID=A0A2R3QWL0_ECTME|nr:hypothetical protein [Pseudomonas mendocina]AVO56100.1 hypothetical protein C7A17_26275 [Pseudomonas mendocina]
MGLLAFRANGTKVVSIYLSDDEWKAEALDKQRDLFMPGTTLRAVPKVSKLGHRFFSHKPGERPNGATGLESEDHIALKVQALLAAKEAGWDAQPEIAGSAPGDKLYRADVMCFHPNGKTKVAIEIQRSSQRDVDYEARQNVYETDGIRGIWIDVSAKKYRKHITNPTRAVPRFECKQLSPGDYVVSINMKEVPFPEFIRGALTGRLRYMDYTYRSRLQYFDVLQDTCWQCEKTIRVIESEYIESLFQEMPEMLPAFNRKTSALSLMCRVKLITFRSGKKYRMCCPHCGIAQREPHPSPEFEYPFAIAQIAISRNSDGLYSRFWSWQSHPKPELIPEPGQIYLLAGFEDDDKERLDALIADLNGCAW